MPTRARLRAAVMLGAGSLIGISVSSCGSGGSPAASAPSPSSGSLAAPAGAAGFAFPIRATVSYGNTHHDYPATDIFARCGSAVVAPTDGVISEVSLRDSWDRDLNSGASRGGLSYSMVGAGPVRSYGSHLRWIVPAVKPGAMVKQGQLIGEVGNTGDAASVACHLHFGISPACGTGDWWVRRGVISPYRYLKAWQAGQNLSPATAVATWRAKHGCPKTPSADA